MFSVHPLGFQTHGYNFDKLAIKKEEICVCSKIENMKHIYQCEFLNKENEKPTFESIFGDDISELVKVNKQFQINYNRTITTPRDPE